MDWIRLPVEEVTRSACDSWLFVGGQELPRGCEAGKERTIDETSTLAFTCFTVAGVVTLRVATTGKPLILRLTGSNQLGPFELNLVERETGEPVKAPHPNAVLGSPVG